MNQSSRIQVIQEIDPAKEEDRRRRNLFKVEFGSNEPTFWTISSYSPLAITASYGHTKCKTDGETVVYSVSSMFKLYKILISNWKRKLDSQAGIQAFCFTEL